MKTKEQIAEQYAEGKSSSSVFQEAHKRDFLAGFEEGQPKWISVDKELPKDDRTVLVWINDTENPQWSNYGLCSYLNEKWYCKGGRDSHEVVTDWCQIPAKKK